MFAVCLSVCLYVSLFVVTMVVVMVMVMVMVMRQEEPCALYVGGSAGTGLGGALAA